MDKNTMNLNTLSRRNFLMKTGLGVGGSALALSGSGCGLVNPPGVLPNLDSAVLTFALNLEYLEAEFYLRAVGQTLSATDAGANPGTVTGGSAVPFITLSIAAYANEIAADEQSHVRLIRGALGIVAPSRPAIDFTTAFNMVGAAAGFGAFNPFADEDSFLLGAFVFEDIGVTAYKGASPLITDRGILETAAGILAVEAYHAGVIRTTLLGRGPIAAMRANGISDARDSLDGASDLDQGITVGGVSNIVPTDVNGVAYSRTTQQVLNLAFLNPAAGVTSGGFFPQGVKGVLIST